MMNAAYLKERITKTKALIEAYEDAALAISSGGVQSYQLDTGQSNQVVTKLNIGVLHKALESLYNRLTMFEARLNGGNSIIVVPSW